MNKLVLALFAIALPVFAQTSINGVPNQSVSGSGTANPTTCTASDATTICVTLAPYYASGAGTTTTTTVGTTGAGTSVVVASASTWSVNQGIYIAGAGAAGANYIGKVTAISGTTFTISPATSTSVATGTLVQHDETNAFQSAITALASTGGTIWVPDGVYRINGPFQNTGTANAILQMPTIANYGQPYVSISIRGFQPVNWDTVAGSQIYTDVTAAGNFIGGYDSATGGGYAPFTNVQLNLENLVLRSPFNSGLWMVQGRNLLSLQMHHVAIGVLSGSGVPTTTTSGGISTPGLANQVQVSLDDVLVANQYTGYLIGEHTSAPRIYAGSDHDGFVFDVGYNSGVGNAHDSNSISVGYAWCQFCVNVVGAGTYITAINIQQLNPEQTTGYGVNDPSNLLRGIINYSVSYPSGSTNYCTINQNGGYFLTLNATQCQGGITLTAPLGGGFGSALNFLQSGSSATPNVSLSNPSSGNASLDTTTPGNHAGNLSLNNLTVNGTCTGCGAGGITLTTTGTSGAATLVGSTLNIPVYSSGGSGAFTNITSLLTPTGCTISGGVCTTTGTVSSITLASIPAGYTSLRIVASGTSSVATTITCQINGDTGSNYAYNGVQSNNSTNPTTNQAVSQTSANCGLFSSLSGQFVLNVPFYASTSAAKSWTYMGDAFTSVSSNTGNYQQNISGLWNSTAAITSIKFIGSVNTGTSFAVYAGN